MRRLSFYFSAAMFSIFILWGFLLLPGFGNYPGPYGDILNAITVSERNVTNVPTAVNFDFRGLDTLGEELILFASVAGLMLLIRKEWGSDAEQDAGEKNIPGQSRAIRLLGFFPAAPTIVFGIYVILHGQLTPGGGFQGGAIIATGLLLAYFTRGTATYRAAAPQDAVEIVEGLAAITYTFIGLGALFAGYSVLHNFLPLGELKDVISGGTISALNLAVGFEVGTGFLLVYSEFIKEIFA